MAKFMSKKKQIICCIAPWQKDQKRQCPLHLAEGAVWEDGVVAGREQREVVPDIVRGGERRAEVQLQHAPVAEQRNLRQPRRHGCYFR